jgi:hypothetical protein
VLTEARAAERMLALVREHDASRRCSSATRKSDADAA